MFKVEVVAMEMEHIDEVMVVESLSFTVPWSRNSFVEELTKNKFSRYIVAKVEGVVVGYAGMWLIAGEGHITNIAVHPSFRGYGIGKKLMDGLICIAKSEGVDRLTLEVRRSNLIAQSLYYKYGFEICGERKAYYTDNKEDALIMWKCGI